MSGKLPKMQDRGKVFMKNNFKKMIILLFIIFYFNGSYKADAEELFFTYIGPTIGAGMNQIAYRGWSSDSDTRVSRVITGYYVNGGCLFDIFVRNFIGEFSLDYIYNHSSGEPEVSLYHLIYTGTAKYAFAVNPVLSLTCGLGAYLETQPSNKSYSGGGLNGAIGTVYDASRDWKIIFDVTTRYGYFGRGDDSSKFSLGAKIGMVYKVGRI